MRKTTNKAEKGVTPLSCKAPEGPFRKKGSDPFFGASRGFTLVELMVVIAIIATLIGILLPSLRAVRTNVKNAQTKVAISVIETGIEAFRADTRCGGSLPPSAVPPRPSGVTDVNDGQALSPHTSASKRIDGASFLFWALAGADQLGTPGFQDLDGDGTWANDTGILPRPPKPAPLYALNGTAPAITRSGPFVDLSKMRVPKMAGPDAFIIPAAKNDATLTSPCFLDPFDQPIIYYRATPANTSAMAVNPLESGSVPGIYNILDNVQITGLAKVAAPGMDFGRGALPADGYHTDTGKYHYLAYLGDVNNKTPAAIGTFLAGPAPNKYSFGYTIWNPSVTAVPRPYNDKSYILLSAGPDGVFGTADDVANFEVNK